MLIYSGGSVLAVLLLKWKTDATVGLLKEIIALYNFKHFHSWHCKSVIFFFIEISCQRENLPVKRNYFLSNELFPVQENVFLSKAFVSCQRKPFPVKGNNFMSKEIISCPWNNFLSKERIYCKIKWFPVKGNNFLSTDIIFFEPMDFSSRKCNQNEGNNLQFI